MLDVCVLIAAIETLFPQETVFNRFGVAITYLQWKVPKTELCFDVIRRNGKWGCVTQFMGGTFGYGHPLTRSDCVHDTLEQAVSCAWTNEVLIGFTRGKVTWEKHARKAYSEWSKSSDKISYFSISDKF
jgi:hypothetical protein|nr:MAG: hypothetical protein [Bacteriophage sp.]UVY04386.1 MAG: hypothetical protein [Bacteriophage sp.]